MDHFFLTPCCDLQSVDGMGEDQDTRSDDSLLPRDSEG